MTIRILLWSVALAVPLSGCRDARVDRLDHATEDVHDQRAEVDPVSGSIAIAELGVAMGEFEARRAGVVEQYRTLHRVFAMQTAIASNLLSDPLLAEDARQKATDQVLILERELEDAEQAIDTLALATVEQWEVGYTTAQTAMMQLEGAHHDAWATLSVERTLVLPS